MIDALNKNIETEISILREISSYSIRLEKSDEQEQRLLKGAINSLKESIKIINNSIPELIRDITLSKELPNKKKKKPVEFERIRFKGEGSEVNIVLSSKDKERFLKELSISDMLVKKLKKKSLKDNKEKVVEFKAARGYFKLANKFFLDRADKLIKGGYFKSLSVDLKRSNMDILFEGYISMMLLTLFISVFVGVIITIFFLFFSFVFEIPFFVLYDGSYLLRAVKIIWIIFAVPILTFLALYFYPSTEKSSLGKKIDQELPFAVIHMSAISGSGIEPSEIFKIVGFSKEYPFLRKEIRKVLNQINLYGYDLVTALNNSSKSAPSERLSELFAGLSSTITSGSDLSEFLEKRAETLLLNYRLERERYTKVAETFLDIYISVVIAAPMILLLLLIMISIAGLGVRFSPAQLSFLSVVAIATINIFFLIFLQIKQPTY